MDIIKTNNISPTFSFKGIIRALEEHNVLIEIEGTGEVISLPYNGKNRLEKDHPVELQVHSPISPPNTTSPNAAVVENKGSSSEAILRAKLEEIIN